MGKNNMFAALQRLWDFGPRTIVRLLTKRQRALVARKLNHPKHFSWDVNQVTAGAQGFEDLTFLFWNCSLNRGLIRQDFDEAAALFKVAKECAGGRAVEIGRWNGGSTLMIAVALGPQGRLLSLDSMPQNDDLLTAMLHKAGVEARVQLVVGDANAYQCEETFDLAFIDGDHSYHGAAQDHNKWGAKVRLGGYIVHHDMGIARPLCTSRRALETLQSDILRVQKNDLQLVRQAGSLVIFQRIAPSWTPLPLPQK